MPTGLAAALSDRYRIERELGAGGMATVYLAHDLKHDRDVAIKVLHQDLAAALGAERFLTEIKTTAKLQHPHILPLLDSGEAAGLLYYVMPYLKGESLRDRLNREKQLPIEDAVRIAREVADALGHAHGHDVIHRDIKPENILLQEGHALVADFGIALAVQSAGGQRMTQTGLSLGTPQYMSPEQAMGEKAIDARADIYALGAVTYEMLTGEPPFTGATVQAIVARVMSERPTPITTFRDTIPEHINAAVMKALAKLPADRWASAASLSNAIVGAQSTQSSARREPRTWRARLPQSLGGMALVAAGWMLARNTGPSAAANTTVRYSMTMPSGVTVNTTNFPTLALSRDGRQIAYATNRGLEIRAVSSFESRVVEASSGATMPFFSPDGKWLGFVTGTSIWKAPVAGGRPVQVSAISPYYATWGDDGNIYFNRDIGAGGIAVMRPDGTEVRNLTAPDSATGEAFHMAPEFLPGGTLLYTATGPTGGWGTDAKLMAIDASGNGPARVVLSGASSGRFVAPGHVVYIDATGQVVVRPFNPRTATVSGDPAVLDTIRSSHWGAAAHVAASREGTLAYVPGTERGKQVVVERDESGRLLRRLHTGNQFVPALSPDGRFVAVSDFTGHDSQIWTIDLRTLAQRRLTFANTVNEGTVWSRDGKRFIYGRQTLSGGREMMLQAIDGAAESKALFSRPAQLFPEAWSPDERWLVYMQLENASPMLYVVHVDSTDKPRKVVDNPFHSDISPDGRWLAYCALDSEGPRLYMVSMPDLRQRLQVTTDGAACVPRFSADGLSLYYVDRASWFQDVGTLHVLRRENTGSMSWGRARKLFPAFAHPFAIERNPTRFILVETDSTKLAREIRLVRGWRP